VSSSWLSTKSDRMSVSWNNSYSPIKDKPPCMSCAHMWSTKASATRRMLRARVGTAANTVGARSLIELPWIHLSVQNFVVDPLPIVVCKAIWKSTATLACIGISRDSQGLLVSVFLSQNHLTCKAQLLSVKTHRRVVTGNTRLPGRWLAPVPRSTAQILAHAVASGDAGRATWSIPDQEGANVSLTICLQTQTRVNISPSRGRLLGTTLASTLKSRSNPGVRSDLHIQMVMDKANNYKNCFN